VDVKEYLAVLLKRKWLVLVCFLLSMACTTAFLFTRQPIYRSDAKLFVTTANFDIVPGNDLIRVGEQSFYSTADQVMQSQGMLRRVQVRMRKTPQEISENLNALHTGRMGGSDIILVSVDSPSKDFARDFANALCDEFLKFRDEERAKTQESALLNLTREINRLNQELKAANERIVAYTKQYNIPLLEADPTLGLSQYIRTQQEISQAATDLNNAQIRKSALDAQHDSAGVVAILQSDSSLVARVNSAAAAQTTADNQILGIGSVLNIQVDQAPPVSVTVGTDGMIELSPLGKFPVSGLTVGVVSQRIQQRLNVNQQSASTVHVTSPAPQVNLPGVAQAAQPAMPSTIGEIDPKTPVTTQGNAGAMTISMIGILSDDRAQKLFQLESERRVLQAHVAQMSTVYRPKHPALIEAKKELDTVVAQIDSEVSFLREQAAAKVQNAKDRYQQLLDSQEPVRNSAMDANLRLMEIAGLRSDAARVRDLYNALLGKLLSIDVLERTSRSVSVLEYAMVEGDPIYPKKVKGLLMAAFVGLGLGLALAYFIEYIDDSIKLAEEVERDLQLPFLGMVPAAQWSPDDLTAHRLDKLKQQGGVAESYRVVRSAIIFSTPRDKLRSILLTSAVPREGKTTTCVNLSIGFAQIEERVLLVDADLRRGELHKYFGFEREKGLADVLLGELTPEQAIRRTNVPKLDVMTSGAYPANPAELLLGWRLKETLDWAHKNYDRVIIDCPPVMGIADSSILGSAVDGVLFIIWAGRTSRRYVRVAKMTAVSRGAKIFGFVLNNLEPGRVGYYHYYPYYYSYYSRGYYYAPKDDEKGKGGDIKGIEVPTPEGGEEKIDDVY
jgi:capsular exopolysaccharide synthesis family protein